MTGARNVSPEVRDKILREHYRTPEGRERLAMSMVRPFETRIGYTSLWRRALEKDEAPFCEPAPYDVTWHADPKDPRKTEAHADAALKLLGSRIDVDLVSRLTTDDTEWDVRKVEGGETAPQVLEDYREFADQLGTILMEARAYADFRRFCRDEMEIETGGPREVLGSFGKMWFWVTRLMPRGEILFVPRTVGRYADVFEVKALGPPGREVEGRMLPEFRLRMKVCMEVDPTKVKAVRYKWEEAS